ncbi:Uma2 family endonuclease [Actinomadura sp. SCN-SB]|uniref:Uma2 family endonuclease n=1 Tax=Actinomadura sp. SCN-SB TaxID=3373092 RepID=UPI003750A0EA
MNTTANPPYVVEIPPHSAVLPDTPYALWESGELHDLLLLPHDGTRVEIIGGEIVVSPASLTTHGGIIQDIADAFSEARFANPVFPWITQQVASLIRVEMSDGYIPDLLVMEQSVQRAARRAHAVGFMPDEIEMAVEVTSPSNSHGDLPPTRAHERTGKNKWSGYASVEIPYYLLVDCSPEAARATLYSIPDRSASAYLHEESWAFGEAIRLPEPFDLRIDTGLWEPWRM